MVLQTKGVSNTQEIEVVRAPQPQQHNISTSISKHQQSNKSTRARNIRTHIFEQQPTGKYFEDVQNHEITMRGLLLENDVN